MNFSAGKAGRKWSCDGPACGERPMVTVGIALLSVWSGLVLSAMVNLLNLEQATGLSIAYTLLVPGRFDRGEMHEYILTILARQKSESFGSVKPLHSSCFFHNVLFLAILVR